jgi:NAD+ kinase
MSPRVGLAVHPRRDVEAAVAALREWADGAGAAVVQVEVEGQQQQVAPFGPVEECDLVVTIGGDGTALAAMRVAGPLGRPVLGVSCGSLGALTAVPADGLGEALERFHRGEWEARELPALELRIDGGEPRQALNDLALVRAGEGQVRIAAAIDGAVYARLAGDGCVVSTPVGSAAYALAAGGPLLCPEVEAMLLTPLPSHGGCAPPLLAAPEAVLSLEVLGGPSGTRLEIDGKIAVDEMGQLEVRLRRGAVTLVAFEGGEPYLTGLRRRGVITDSPRLLAEDRRAHQHER